MGSASMVAQLLQQSGQGCRSESPLAEGEYRGSFIGEFRAVGGEFPMTITITMEGPMDVSVNENGLLSGAVDLQFRMRGEAEGLPPEVLAALNADASGHLESESPGRTDRFSVAGPVAGLLDITAAADGMSGEVAEGVSDAATMEFKVESKTCTTASGVFLSGALIVGMETGFESAGMTFETVRQPEFTITRQSEDDLLETMAEIEAGILGTQGGTRDETIAATAAAIQQIRDGSFSDAEKDCLLTVAANAFRTVASPAQRALLREISSSPRTTDDATVERIYGLIRDAIAWDKDLYLLGCPGTGLDEIAAAAGPVLGRIAQKLAREARWREALRIDRDLAMLGRSSAGVLEQYQAWATARANEAFNLYRGDRTYENAVRGLAADKLAQAAGGTVDHRPEYCAAFAQLCGGGQ